MSSTTTIDAITLELIKGAMQSARREMEALIDRTAMSPFIREKKDYFTAIFDGRGQLVVSTALTLAAGNLIDCVFARYPAETMKPGDLFIYNDSYGSKGAVSHNNDMVFIQPIFAEGRLIGFAEGWGHLWDIGGMVPGSISPAATDVFQEGIVIPPTRILRDGVWNDDLIATFMRNTRFPTMVKGDFSALTAAVQLGRRRMEEIAAQFGAAMLETAFAAIIDETERATRQAIADHIPDGRFSFRDWIDGDCVTDNSYSVAVTLEKQDGKLSFDFTGTDDQAKGAINFIMDPAVPKGILGLYLTSRETGILPNAGYRRAMADVAIRDSSLLAPREPAPLGMRSHSVMRVNSSIFAALAKATGGQAAAASAVYVLYYLRSLHKTTGQLDLCIEGLAVGFGARPFGDGIDAVYYVAQKNYPVEFAEMEFGVQIEGYALHRDSGGPGRWRGGMGIVRDLRVIADEAVIGVRMDNIRYPAFGVADGMAGRSGRIIVNPGRPDERQLKPLSDGNVLKNGDVVRIMTSGGGGWGSPIARPAAQVRDDVLDGFVSADSARDDYGVVLSEDLLDIDEPATAALRRKLGQIKRGMFHRHGYFDDHETPLPARIG
jgi:N-methylhydantoinase B